MDTLQKIVVGVETEEELLNIYEKAKEKNILVERIDDNGQTVFYGVTTFTCIAVGPDTSENLQEITGHLKLLK